MLGRQECRNLPKSVFLKEKQRDEGEQIAELFASHFSSIYQHFESISKEDVLPANLGNILTDGTNFIELTYKCLLNALLSFNSRKGQM